MLQGLDAGPIIAGAYTSRDGICPMLAAHRAGGRCSAAFFADAWDRFAFRDGRGRRGVARRVNERELRILRVHLEASLLDEELADVSLAGALRAHRELLARRQTTVDPAPVVDRVGKPTTTRGRRHRLDDRARAAELGGRAGWAWSRLFRRCDEYEAALVHLHAAAGEAALVHLHAAAGSGQPPDRRSDRAETVNV
jgi:hypothetical protein